MRRKRVVHITLEKCGSQWVRDVLCAPEIEFYSGMSCSGETCSFLTKVNFELPEGKFSGPIFAMNRAEWHCWKCPGDKAVVVLRDPRDRLISYFFSLFYSHSIDQHNEWAKNRMSNIKNDSQRIKQIINGFSYMTRFYLGWAIDADEDALVVRYELLVQDQRQEFGRILEWLGWHVPDKVLKAVVERLSFKNRSGRSPGETDIFSHYRRGIQGDWRNYFSREHGKLWEQLYPGFLKKIGYENSDDWWLSLPEEVNETGPSLSKHNDIDSAKDHRIQILTQRIQKVEKELTEKEQEIQRLAKACTDRLTLIEKQDKELKNLRGLNE